MNFMSRHNFMAHQLAAGREIPANFPAPEPLKSIGWKIQSCCLRFYYLTCNYALAGTWIWQWTWTWYSDGTGVKRTMRKVLEFL